MTNRFFSSSSIPSVNPGSFSILNDEDVVTARVSDHHPIVHHGVIFWNVMMQGNIRKDGGYNNGFGLIETDKQYGMRLVKIAEVIAEIILRHPSVEMISLCEGPNQPAHQKILFNALKKFPWIQRFLKNDEFHQPNIDSGSHWGLLMLADQSYTVKKIKCIFSACFFKLTNRMQIWELIKNGRSRYLALAHLPFRNDENITEKSLLSADSQKYNILIQQLLKLYAHQSFILCADFNSNPYLINHYQDRVLDQITHNNSILLLPEKTGKMAAKKVTVDGVLLSVYEKQRYQDLRGYPGLFKRLQSEQHLFSTSIGKDLERKTILY